MRIRTRIGICVVIAAFAMFAMCSTALASEKKSFKEASKCAVKTTIDYPANLLNETVNVVGTAAKNTGEVVVDTAKATGNTLAGHPEKAGEIISTPVVGSAEAIKDAAVCTAKCPVMAGRKTAEQN